MTERPFSKDCIKNPQLVTPSAVKAIISKIEAAQLNRAQEDISIQLSDILGNVNGVISRFQDDLGSDLKDRKTSQRERDKGKKRFVLLEKIASFSKAAETKERNLYEILSWMSEWGDNLTYETRTKEREKECDKQDEWVEVMERVLPLSLIATEGGIESLISLCSNLIEEQKKRTLRPKGNFWKAWREKILHKSSSLLQPLSPEQMLKDKNTTNAKVGEVQAMIRELLDSAIFNKGEIKAIKYISTMVENLNQAFILQFQENCKLKTQYQVLEGEMSKEIKDQRLLFQKELRVLEDMKNTLEGQVQASEQKYQQLLLEEEVVKYQLQMGGGDRDRSDFAEFVSRPLKAQAPQKMNLSTIKEVLEMERESKPEEMKSQSPLKEGEEKEAGKIFPKTKDADVKMGVDHTPFLQQPLAKMSVYPKDSKNMDIHADSAVESKSEVTACYDGKDDTASEKMVATNAVWIEGDKASDFPRETWGDLPAATPLEETTGISREKQEEEERHWQQKRRQWKAEEKWWQEQQRKWEKLERDHKERQRRWRLEEEEMYKNRQEYMHYKWLMMHRREPEEQRLEQSKESYGSSLPSPRNEPEEMRDLVPRGYRSQSALGRLQTPGVCEPQLFSINTFGSQGAHLGSMKLGFPCIGMPVRPFPGAFLSKCSPPGRLISLPKENKYWVDIQGQRMNLLLLNGACETLGFPAHLHNLARKLISKTLHTTITRFRYLIQKYRSYRTFQCVKQDVMNRVEANRKNGNIADAQNSYIILERIDKCQSHRLQTWTEKQKVLEEERGDCLDKMISLFSQLQEKWNLNLSLPVLRVSTEKQKKTAVSALKKYSHFTRAGGTQPKQFLMAKHRDYPELMKIARERGNEIEAIWKTDLSTSSYPVTKKTPSGVIWSQIGGYPDFPRMVELNVPPSCHRCLKSLRTRSPSVFKRKSTTERENEFIPEQPTESIAEI